MAYVFFTLRSPAPELGSVLMVFLYTPFLPTFLTTVPTTSSKNNYSRNTTILLNPTEDQNLLTLYFNIRMEPGDLAVLVSLVFLMWMT